MSSSSKLNELIAEMLINAPDKDEPLPISNRKETIYGTTVPFLLVSWVAVIFRLWVRFRVVRNPGWDDLLVTIASITNTIATICVLISIEHGLGRHYLYLGRENMTNYIRLFYIENAIYISQTSIIKMSLLFQYLRIFKAGTMRWICLTLLVIITLWGIGYGFMAWFPCFPVHGYWNKEVPAKCYGFGFENRNDFIALFESHTALNMTFDVAVFLTPMVLFTAPNLTKKNLIGLTGIFLFGAIVIFTSVWRLYTIIVNRAATYPYIDFTWWPPISIILSCLEIDLAIICASMPVFWPVLEAKISQIFVTQEVRVSIERRMEERGLEYELEHGQGIKRFRSASGNSEEALTTENTSDLDKHYHDQYVVAQVDPLAEENAPGARTETEIESKPKPKWRL